jgi:hypothetical protein
MKNKWSFFLLLPAFIVLIVGWMQLSTPVQATTLIDCYAYNQSCDNAAEVVCAPSCYWIFTQAEQWWQDHCCSTYPPVRCDLPC